MLNQSALLSAATFCPINLNPPHMCNSFSKKYWDRAAATLNTDNCCNELGPFILDAPGICVNNSDFSFIKMCLKILYPVYSSHSLKLALSSSSRPVILTNVFQGVRNPVKCTVNANTSMFTLDCLLEALIAFIDLCMICFLGNSSSRSVDLVYFRKVIATFPEFLWSNLYHVSLY